MYWPLGDTPFKEEDERKLGYLKDRYITAYQYSHLWENDVFSVYRSPLDDPDLGRP
jgi:hypothetical protein